ncbi:alpha/beta hydrolase [Rhodococcus gordoniae]|nr:alpha/beta hydrolase [Rhodococcus gordoniae]
MDRRGHGDSPDLDGACRTDYEVDAADIVELLGDGAHLVGHSYDAVAAILAAAERPDLVRSLYLIQPGCLKVAESEPVVAENLARARGSQAALPPEFTAEDYLRLTTESVGMLPAEATPKRLRAASTSMRETPCWDAGIPLEPIAAAPWPKLVVVGDRAGAPDEYKRLAGDPLPSDNDDRRPRRSQGSTVHEHEVRRAARADQGPHLGTIGRSVTPRRSRSESFRRRCRAHPGPTTPSRPPVRLWTPADGWPVVVRVRANSRRSCRARVRPSA